MKWRIEYPVRKGFGWPTGGPRQPLMYPLATGLEKVTQCRWCAQIPADFQPYSTTNFVFEKSTFMAVDKSNQRVRKMFGEIAPNYDRMNHLLSMNVDKYWRWKTVRKLKPNRSDPILDVCTGTGDLAFAFEKSVGGEVPVIGSDFCYEMLAVGEQKKPGQQQPQEKNDSRGVTFVEADAQNLPFPDDEFQIVSAAFGLRNVADTDLGLREMTRVCKPGGQVAILEFSVPRMQPIKGMYGWYFKNVLPKIGQALARNNSSAYDYLPDSVGEFPCYEALAEKMKAAGMARVEFFPLTFGIATLYVGVK